MHTTTYDTWTEQGDPHTRLIIDIVEIDRVPHGCRVVATWGEKSEIIKRLSASVVLAEATTRLEYGAEVIRWMARARGIPVEIELRVPTYVNEPGRSLTLYMKAEPMHDCKLPNLEPHLPSDSR